jgi:Cu/Ag efflux protein CusF
MSEEGVKSVRTVWFAYKKVNTFHSFLQNVQIALTMHFDLDDQRGGKTQRLSGREAKETRILE